MLLGVPSERSLEPLSGSFAASWEPLVCVLGVPWRPLEPFWRPLGDLLGPPGASVGSLGASCGPLGAEGVERGLDGSKKPSCIVMRYGVDLG